MRKDRLYIALLIFSVAVYAASEILKPKPVDWSPDFTQSGYIPFSSHILYDELDSVFPENRITENRANLFDRSDFPADPTNWIFINDKLSFDEYETEILLNRVEHGDDLFLSGLVTGAMSDSLNLNYEFFYSFFDSTATKDTLRLSLNRKAFQLEGGWGINARGSFYHITSFDSSYTEVLGNIEGRFVNFIVTEWGNGKIFVNSTPYLFTNYYLRNPESATYAFAVLSHLPERSTVWDEYYKAGRKGMDTPMYVILNTEPLKFAWYTTLLGLFLFIVFKAKRRQRIIPVITPPENSSLTFTRTIARLYQEQGNHKEILQKKIRFFYEYIKHNLRLDITEIDDHFKQNLASRSGVELKKVFRLFDLLDLVEKKQTISDKELKMVTDHIDQFYKYTQR